MCLDESFPSRRSCWHSPRERHTRLDERAPAGACLESQDARLQGLLRRPQGQVLRYRRFDQGAAITLRANYSAEIERVKGASAPYFVRGNAAKGQLSVFVSEPGEADFDGWLAAAVRGGVVQQLRKGGQAMEPLPELYYRPPSLRMPNVALSTSARVVQRWWAAHTQEAVMWMLVLLLALAVGALAANV